MTISAKATQAYYQNVSIEFGVDDSRKLAKQGTYEVKLSIYCWQLVTRKCTSIIRLTFLRKTEYTFRFR
jgi:hypothetical protein